MGANYSTFEATERQLLNPLTSEELTTNLTPENDRIQQLKTVQREALTLFIKKNQDYGDAFATYGTVGVLVRMGDKLARLQTITSTQVTLIDTESIRDTLIDLHNYSAMAIMLLDEDKSKVKNRDFDTLMSDFSMR